MNEDKITKAAAGGIGAGVALAVIAAVLAILTFTGFISFGKKAKKEQVKSATYNGSDADVSLSLHVLSLNQLSQLLTLSIQ
jgi:hypothetical protein